METRLFPTNSSENSRSMKINLEKTDAYPMGRMNIAYSRSVSGVTVPLTAIRLFDAGQWQIVGNRDTSQTAGTSIIGDSSYNLTSFAYGENISTGSKVKLLSNGNTGVVVESELVTFEGNSSLTKFNGHIQVVGTSSLSSNTTIDGAPTSWQNIVKTQISYGSPFGAYSGFATPTYWRDSIRVSLSGVIGITVTSAVFNGGTTYDLGSIPSAYAPDQNILFSPLVGPLMSANCIFYVMATGALRLYIPSTVTLSQANFYVGMDGMSWLRKA